MTPRNAHCCLCGEPRRPTQAPVESFGNGCELVSIADHRPLRPGRWEDRTSMLVNVSMWRNGGTAPGQTHICDGCIVVGLEAAKRFVDAALYALGAGAPASGQEENQNSGLKTFSETGPNFSSEPTREAGGRTDASQSPGTNQTNQKDQ